MYSQEKGEDGREMEREGKGIRGALRGGKGDKKEECAGK